MGVAFQMTADQAGDAMVALRASMGLTQPQVEQLGDAINFLSDKFQGTVSAADLTEVTRRIGAIGKAAGLTSEQVAGMGAAFLASGTPAEVASTGLKNFLNALTKGQQATQSQSFALATLFRGDGMAEQLKRGKGAAKKEAKKVAIGIAEELAKGMQAAPEATIKSVLERMTKLPKEQQVSIAGALFGEESKSAIMPLLTNLKLVEQGFDLVREKSAFAGSMQKEFANQQGTASAQMTIFRNGINALGISIGTAILPSLNAIMKAIGPILVGFAEWAQNNQWLVTGIVLIGGALAGLVIALPIIAGVVSAIGTIGAAIAVASPIIAGIGTVIAVLATGPIAIAAAAIAGIGALAFVVVKNWKPISGFFSRLWQSVIQATSRLPMALLGIIAPIPTAIWMLFTRANIGQRIITSIIDGLKARAGALFGWIGGAVSRIGSMFGGGTAAPAAAPASPVAPSNNIVPGPSIPGRALGGRVRAGFPYIVGERRRELFVPGLDGSVVPRVARPLTAAAMAALLAGPAPAAAAPSRAPVVLNASVTINAPGGDANAIAHQVEVALADLVRRLEAEHRTLLND